MTRDKHTPGPWWMAAVESRPSGAYAVGAGDEELACFKCREDALLAKCAPDLLAALEQAALTLERCKPLDGAGDLALADIHAVIAKARGGS